MTVSKEGMSSSTDLDLHGIVGMRLVNASAKDIATVIRQVGPIQAALNREPDIIIRFVDELSVSSPIKYLEVDEAGYTNDAFLILRSKHKSRARVQIPFEQIGKQCEIVCEKGLAAVDELKELFPGHSNLAALAIKWVLMNAALSGGASLDMCFAISCT